MKLLRAFFAAWTWRMAWRDSRASRGKLLLFSSSIVIGEISNVGAAGVSVTGNLLIFRMFMKGSLTARNVAGS